MMSRIEQVISDIEAYLDDCKFQPFSNTKIIVDKDQLEDMLAELRLKTPEEIKKYQKIINNKEAILNSFDETMIQPDEAMNLTEMRAYVKGFEDARNAMFDATDKFYRSNKTD